ncbi:hypothetical protein [Methyloferula stellata]|uniref:hypothetical protein n=1 Tax=Methyloferula stellata TaxID=876270 RepID=UPI0003A4CFD1|nr:hypothetical protein [Methyloferula stellata]
MNRKNYQLKHHRPVPSDAEIIDSAIGSRLAAIAKMNASPTPAPNQLRGALRREYAQVGPSGHADHRGGAAFASGNDLTSIRSAFVANICDADPVQTLMQNVRDD